MPSLPLGVSELGATQLVRLGARMGGGWAVVDRSHWGGGCPRVADDGEEGH